MKLSTLLNVFAVLILFASSVFADTLNVNPSADTWIFAEATGNNMGGADNLATGINNHNSKMRALLKFDLSAIPANATVTSATLTMTAVVAHFAAPDATFDLHRVLQDWGEGTGVGNTGALANPDEATWTARFNGTANWNTAGAASPTDFSATTSSSITVSALGSYTFNSTANLVADVQAWVSNPANNFGWIMIDRNENTLQTARRWASKESGTGPTLTVSYTAAAAPQRPLISGPTITNNQFRFKFNAEANRTYTVERQSVLNTNGWTVLTNISASPVATNVTVSDAVSVSTNRFYRVKTP